MGHLESKSRKQTRNRKLKFLLLGCVALTGGVAIALVAPNVLGAMGKLGIIPKQRADEYIRAARKRLKRQGLLVEEDGFLRISPRGEKELVRLSLSLAHPEVLKRWDRKWRVLIFDVPEKRKKIRDHIRSMLRSAGFERIQDSVWLFPYPCEEYVALLKADLRIGKDLLYMIVDSLEGDEKFRKLFKLPPSPDSQSPPVKLPKLVETLLDPIFPKYVKSTL